LSAALLVFIPTSAAQETNESGQEVRYFGGSYSTLAPGQTRLIEDWVQSFIEVTGREIDSETFYDEYIRLSTKTTFDAVTHALMMTTLTDGSETSLGTALDLVAHMETVKGKIKGERGDRQFRMYVKLVPDAIEKLNKSREFNRAADNTIYHKGYPINYRQSGSIPSIQISIAHSGDRADIDVDYRSSKFPVALFNGHLTASNSDVRAGDNHERHNSRWEGFANWWRNLFGVRLRNEDYVDDVTLDEYVIPEFPRAGKGKLQDAVYDFLKAWLVEQKPNQAMAYFSERSYACVEVTEAVENRGMIPVVLLAGMQEIVNVVGKPDDLADVVVGVRFNDRALRLVRQPYHELFVLYGVRDDVALTFDCANRTQVADASSIRAPHEFGNYYGSIFYIQGPADRGATLALLWAQESGDWKIVSYELEPYAEDDIETGYQPPEVAELERVEGDPAFVTTVQDFLSSWFLEEDFGAAFGYLSPLCYSCYNLSRAEGRPEARTAEEAARYLREGLSRTDELIGSGHSNLSEFIGGVEPSHPLIRLVTHGNEDAFTLVSVPNATWEWFHCDSGLRDQPIPLDIPTEYGDYYALLFQFRMKSGEAPVMRSLWSKEEGKWKMVSYDVVTP
jgi:hypothetical protein